VCVCVIYIIHFYSDEYKTARRNLGKAEITSDFASEAEIVGKRIKKPNKKYNSSSDSSEDNDTFKKSSVRISKTSNKKQSKKECISKSIEISSNSTDSEANETSHLIAKDVGSSQSCKCQIVCIKNQRRFYKKLVIHIQQKVPLNFLSDRCITIAVIINLRKIIFCYYFVLLEVRLHMTKSLTFNCIFLKLLIPILTLLHL